MTIPARKTQYNVIHEISASIAYNDPNVTTGIQIGTLPAGAIATITRVLTSTAWNGTTSVVLSVGTTLTGTNFINASDVRTAIARADTVVPAAVMGPFAADTPIYASGVFGGTVGTAGLTTVVVEFLPVVG